MKKILSIAMLVTMFTVAHRSSTFAAINPTDVEGHPSILKYMHQKAQSVLKVCKEKGAVLCANAKNVVNYIKANTRKHPIAILVTVAAVTLAVTSYNNAIESANLKIFDAAAKACTDLCMSYYPNDGLSDSSLWKPCYHGCFRDSGL
jgi:hypothetical protein